MTKQELRQAVRARMALLTKEDWQKTGDAICRRVLALWEYKHADTVCCFVGTGAEIRTDLLLTNALQSGKRLCLPACTGKGLMEMRQIYTLQDLHTGSYNLPEPPESAQVIPPCQIDFMLVPCLCCTSLGIRLGKGGGFFDRYLSGFYGASALLCPEAFLCPSVPADGWDVPIPLVITEAQTYRI